MATARRVDKDGAVDAGDLADEAVIQPRRLDSQRLASKPGCLGGGAFGDDEHSSMLGIGRRSGESPQSVAVTLPENTARDIVEPLTPQPLLGQPRRSELHRCQRDAGVV